MCAGVPEAFPPFQSLLCFLGTGEPVGDSSPPEERRASVPEHGDEFGPEAPAELVIQKEVEGDEPCWPSEGPMLRPQNRVASAAMLLSSLSLGLNDGRRKSLGGSRDHSHHAPLKLPLPATPLTWNPH